MFSHFGLVQVLTDEAYVQVTIRLMAVGEQRYLFGRLGDRCNNSLPNHFIEGALYLFPVLDRYLPMSMLDWGNAGVCPDGISPRHVANGVKGNWKGPLQGNDVLDCGGRARGSCLCQLYLEG